MLTDELVHVATTATRSTPDVRRAGLRSLFDFVGCVIAGSEAIPTWPGEWAGRLALAAHLRDQDDFHVDSVTHPGGVIWSVLIAAASERDVSLAQALEAAAFGYELTIRLAEAAGAEHRARWHVTTTAGTVGAAGAAADIFELAPEEIGHAVAHAVSVAGGSPQTLVEHSETRFLHRAHAAHSGMVCARAASAGLTATKRGFESGSGAFATEDVERFRAMLLRRRSATAIAETGFRLHAATGFAHAAIDAALQIGPLEPEEVSRVTVKVSPPSAMALASNKIPATDDEAWWSIEHAVATSLGEGRAGALVGRLSQRADIRDLCTRVDLVSEGVGWAASVKVSLHDGSIREAKVDGPIGQRPHVASDDDLCRKWLRLTGTDGSWFLNRLIEAHENESFESVLRDAFRYQSNLQSLFPQPNLSSRAPI